MSDDGLDALQSDMRAHQLRFRGEVTASENQQIAARAMERVDREQAEAKPAPVAAPAPLPTGTRDGAHGRYLMEAAKSDDMRIVKASPQQHWWFTHAMPRVQLLLTKEDTGPLGQPSWKQRLLWVFSFKSKVPGALKAGLYDYARELDLRFVFELEKLLDDSSASFGDWRADAPTTIQVAVR